MPLSDQWNRAQLRTAARDELQDSSAKWWTDTEVNGYLEHWQKDVQGICDFVWGSTTVLTDSATHTITNIAPNVERLDKIYWNSVRLSPRTHQDLEILYQEWKTATSGSPTAAYQVDDEGFVLWPPPTVVGTLEIEYPTEVSFSNSDSIAMQVPAWTKYSAINYVAWRAYERLGPNMDLNQALRYKRKFTEQANEYASVYAGFFPYRYPQLRPATKYEIRILEPGNTSAGAGTSTGTGTYTVFGEYTPSGTKNGTNTAFTIPIVPTEMQLYANGVFQYPAVDYTQTGTALAMTVAPDSATTLKAITFTGLAATYGTMSPPVLSTATGTMNGTNTLFTVSPGYNSIALYLNNILQIVDTDFTFSGVPGEITFIGTGVPASGDTLVGYLWYSTSLYGRYASAPTAQVPSGTMDGANATFTLAASTTMTMLFLNGAFLAKDVGYTLSGTTITMQSGYIPFTGDTLYAFYW